MLTNFDPVVASMLTAFFASLDSGVADPIEDIFFADAELDLGLPNIAPLVGRAAITEAVTAKPADRLTRHQWTNLAVVDSAMGKVGHCQVTVFQKVGDAPAKLSHVCDIEVELARDADGISWKAKRMSRQVVMSF